MICGCPAPYMISDQQTIFTTPPILCLTKNELIVLLIIMPTLRKLGGLDKVKGVEVDFDVTSIGLGLLAGPDGFLLIKSSSSILKGLWCTWGRIGDVHQRI